jgi:DNA mismatch repair protein MSH5
LTLGLFEMRSSQKRKKSPEILRYHPVIPRTYGSRPGKAPYASSRAFLNLEGSFQTPSPLTDGQVQPSFLAESQAELEGSQLSAEDDIGHVIAAIDIKDCGTVGCAYYSAEKERMYLLTESRLGERDTIEACTFIVEFGLLLWMKTDCITSDTADQTYSDPSSFSS